MMTREEVVKEAMTWLGTPYLTRGMVKGGGCDCGTFPFAVYKACGIIPAEDEMLEKYKQDWFGQATDDRYLKYMMKYAPKIMETISNFTKLPLPGNFVMSKSRPTCPWYLHGGIVTRWPNVINQKNPKVMIVCAWTDPLWAHKEIVILDPWEKSRVFTGENANVSGKDSGSTAPDSTGNDVTSGNLRHDDSQYLRDNAIARLGDMGSGFTTGEVSSEER